MKYPIAEELLPITKLPVPSTPAMVPMLNKVMGMVFSCKSDDFVHVEKHKVASFDGEMITVSVISPKGSENEQLPCFVVFHGGGFLLRATSAHYQLAKEYAARVPCRVIYPDYRLAPSNPFPTPVEDCYASYKWAVENVKELRIDPSRIAIGGDSAGGNLAAAVTLMARDRGESLPKTAMLIYPVTDRRMETASMQAFTDTPVWNGELSKMMWKAYLGEEVPENIAYASPMEATSLAEFPETYLEVAEFDCLRDEGVAFHQRLLSEGVPSRLYRVEAACHGYELAVKSSITRTAMDRRIAHLQAALSVK